MEPEGSLPCPYGPTANVFYEPNQSSSHFPKSEFHFNIVILSKARSKQYVSFLQVFRINIWYIFYLSISCYIPPPALPPLFDYPKQS
jgi:hypothetical protein